MKLAILSTIGSRMGTTATYAPHHNRYMFTNDDKTIVKGKTDLGEVVSVELSKFEVASLAQMMRITKEDMEAAGSLKSPETSAA